ncbi:MAG: helix-turn-helix transcriptional regulator [Planctomycetes bacterium]|nr:helix-turn-helix transcriptional regulator [Planctomycetota bacterium]
MITNDRQYRISKAQAARFERTLAQFDESPSGHPEVPQRLIRAQREALASQLESLRQEIKEYERLRGSRRRPLDLAAIAELPETLIRARIAAGLTQRQLASRLGLKEQQIQRYEKDRYARASLARVLSVARALASE